MRVANPQLQASIRDRVGVTEASCSVAFEDLTIFTLATCGPSAAAAKFGPMPGLPSSEIADRLLQTCYQHTQAHICVVDWAMLNRWHKNREATCFASVRDGSQPMKQAYFIWMAYAIGAQLDKSSEVPCSGYYARALQYLHAPLMAGDIITVQALLMLAQYSFRATVGAETML